MAKSTVANPTYAPLQKQSTYKTFQDFYPFYLGEHNNVYCRRLHLVGTGISSLILARVAVSAVSLLTLPPAVIDAIHTNLGSAGIKLIDGFLRAQLAARLTRPAWQYIAAGIGQGYFLAWIGHFFFEKNKPATFTHPLYSFQGDLKMLWEVVTLQRRP